MDGPILHSVKMGSEKLCSWLTHELQIVFVAPTVKQRII